MFRLCISEALLSPFEDTFFLSLRITTRIDNLQPPLLRDYITVVDFISLAFAQLGPFQMLLLLLFFFDVDPCGHFPLLD